MQKKTIRVLCAVLVLLMTLPLIFSCQKKPSEPSSSESGAQDNGTKVETLEVPSDLRYDGETFHILTAGQVAYTDFTYTTEEETVLGQAQYKRKLGVEERFGIKIEETKKENKSATSNVGYNPISQMVLSSDVTFHLGIIGGYCVSNLAMENFLYDLNSVDYIETSKSWWDQNANDDLTINGMLFFTNGNLTGAYSESTFVIFYNKQLGEQKNIPDIYDIVRDEKWTIDRLTEFSKTVSEDLDGNGQMDPNDRYGLYVWDDSIIGMLGAAGTKCATVHPDGTIALTLYNENTVNMFNKFTELAFNQAYAITYQRFTAQMDTIANFQSNHALFWATSNVNTPKIRDMEADFGILPYPKLSEDQTRYYSTIAPYNSQFICVPYIDDPDVIKFVGAVTETLAYEGQKTVWPALYEQTLKGAFSRDEGTLDMLDVIYSSYVYDIGYYYQIGKFNAELLNLIRKYNTNFNSMYESYKSSAEGKLNDINNNYKEVMSEWAK